MRMVKAAIIGLALIGFSGSAAFAQAGCGSSKGSAQTTTPDTKQTTVSSDTKK